VVPPKFYLFGWVSGTNKVEGSDSDPLQFLGEGNRSTLSISIVLRWRHER